MNAWRPLLFSLVCASFLISNALSQQLEHEPRPQGEPRPAPYLAAVGEVDFNALLAPPPAVDSILDESDRRAIERFQAVDDARRHIAEEDDQTVYPRFEEAFGQRIDRKSTAALVVLLNRTFRGVSATAFAAKEQFSRPRPYQRGESVAPKPEAHPMQGSSYPSGHSAYGWAVAMVLARVAPDRALALMARAAEYAQSRLICGVHFPSDVFAGQTMAAAVLSRLDASSEFQADLARAKAELSKKVESQ